MQTSVERVAKGALHPRGWIHSERGYYTFSYLHVEGSGRRNSRVVREDASNNDFVPESARAWRALSVVHWGRQRCGNCDQSVRILVKGKPVCARKTRRERVRSWPTNAHTSSRTRSDLVGRVVGQTYLISELVHVLGHWGRQL